MPSPRVDASFHIRALPSQPFRRRLAPIKRFSGALRCSSLRLRGHAHAPGVPDAALVQFRTATGAERQAEETRGREYVIRIFPHDPWTLRLPGVDLSPHRGLPRPKVTQRRATETAVVSQSIPIAQGGALAPCEHLTDVGSDHSEIETLYHNRRRLTGDQNLG